MGIGEKGYRAGVGEQACIGAVVEAFAFILRRHSHDRAYYSLVIEATPSLWKASLQSYNGYDAAIVEYEHKAPELQQALDGLFDKAMIKEDEIG